MKIYNKRIFGLLSLFLTLLFAFSSAWAFEEVKPINKYISFTNPWVRLLPPTLMHTAAYVEINNSSKVADKLLNVWSPAVKSVSVHQTKEVDGLLTMLEASNISIPPMGKLVLQPGGYHLMLMGLKNSLKENETLTINFEFEKAGVLPVTFNVLKK